MNIALIVAACVVKPIKPPGQIKLVAASRAPWNPRKFEFIIEETGTIRAMLHGGMFHYNDPALVLRLVTLN